MEKEERKIYPYLIDSTRMAGYYELLLDAKYKLKIFNDKSDKELYDYFLPLIRKYLFWTFDVKKVSELKEMSQDLQATICDKYSCNVFEKGENLVVCFGTGVCFAVTTDKKAVAKLKEYESRQEMEDINLRGDTVFDIPKNSKGELAEAHIYAYILEIYKKIYLEKLSKNIQNPDIFDKVRNAYVKFTQEIYDVQFTDKDDVQEKWDKEFKLDEKRLIIDNEFDLLYKNNKLNDHLNIVKIAIVLFIVLIIIGMFNLGNWLS